MSNALLERLHGLAAAFPGDAVALRDGRRSLAYANLPGVVADIGDWLQTTGSHVVGLQLQNGIDWVLLDLACQAAGIVVLPLPDFFSAAQIEHCLQAAGADLLVTDGRGKPPAGEPLDAPFAAPLRAWRLTPTTRGRVPENTAKITFTSGSTGAPKGVCLSAAQQWQLAKTLVDAIGTGPKRHLCLLPLATLLENVAGIYAPLLQGAQIILPDATTRGLSGSSGLDARALLHCIDTEQPHSMILLPQLLLVLVAACERGWQPPRSLQFVAVGGAHVANGLVETARRLGLPVYEGYGLSECGSVVALNSPAADRAGSVGRVLPHCEVTVDDGEIVVRGAVHLGYLNDPQSWYPECVVTGDLGALDDAGYLRIRGRRKNLLISSFGRNISPEWIESELCARPLFTHCVVVGDGRPYLSALVGAPDAIADSEIRQWIDTVNLRLPDYAQIKAWLRMGASIWPPLYTANGRPRRDQIDSQLAGRIQSLYAKAPLLNTANTR
jgi:long-subunit acyl-CoA synthetase (AMP-forming)